MRSFLKVLFLIASLVTCTINCQQTTTTGGGVKDASAAATTDNGCIIQESVHNGTFDLNGLRSTTTHTYSAPLTGDFSFNMCGGLNPTTCNNVTGVAACFKSAKTNKEYILGYQSATPVMQDSLIFKYTGERCENQTKDGNRNFSLEIIAECDYNNEVDPISLIKSDSCDFLLRYKSSKACLQSQAATTKSQCQFPLNGTRNFNLAQLPKGNQRVVGSASSSADQDFIVSLCRPVIYTPSSACPPDTNFCVFDKKKKTFSSVGGGSDVQLIQDEASILLKYSSNTPCEFIPGMNMSSTIEFFCDRTQTNKILYDGQVACTHSFQWFSPQGCETQTPCMITDPNNGFTYDLTSLKNKSFNVTTSQNAVYNFGVCTAPKECTTTSGACDAQGRSLGVINSALTYNETGYPFLMYDNGPDCKTNKYFTKIEFKCAESDAEDGKTFLVEDTNCRLIVQLATKLACNSKISCKDSLKGQDFDLTPLMMSSGNYVALVDKALGEKDGKYKEKKFYLNVCRPLVPQYGLSCSGGSAVCSANLVNDKPENETSLGYPDISLTIVNNSDNVATPQLKYLRGDACPSDPTDKSTSTIQFQCNPKVGRGTPVLKTVEDDCHYFFDWETNVICPSAALEYKNCVLTDKSTGGSLDLRNTTSKGNVTLTNGAIVSVCELTDYSATIDYFSQLVYLTGRASTNQKTVVPIEVTLECRGKINGGFAVSNGHNALHNYTITFIHESVCKLFNIEDKEQVTGATTVSPVSPSGNSSEIVTTNTTTTTTTPIPVVNGQTTLAPSNSSSTSVAPSDKQEATTAENKAAPPPPPAKSGMSAWGIMGVILVICSVFVLVGWVARSPVRRAKVMSLFRRKNVAVSYTRVSNEASLLMVPAGLSESDDELLV